MVLLAGAGVRRGMIGGADLLALGGLVCLFEGPHGPQRWLGSNCGVYGGVRDGKGCAGFAWNPDRSGVCLAVTAL